MYGSRNLCSLCLNKSCDVQEFSEKDISDIIQKLQKVIPQTKLQTENCQFICEVCLLTAKELHQFLSQFFEANFRVCYKLKSCQSLKLDIRTLYPRTNCGVHGNFSICRICLSSVARPNVFLYASPRNVLHYEWYFEMLSYCDISPKLFDLTTDPIMCNTCWQHLQTFFTFKKLYFERHGEVLHFSQELRKRNIHESDKKVLLKKFRELSNDSPSANTSIVANQVDISHFSKNKILELLFLYLLATENETNFIPEFWKKTMHLWNDLNKDDLITEEELLTFMTLLLKGTLVSKEECEHIKSQIVQFGNMFNRGRRLSSAMSQYDISNLQQTSTHQKSNTQLTSNNCPTDDGYDDTCPDITSDINPSLERKSEHLDEITIDCCPELEVQTNISDNDMEMRTFQESTKTGYYFRCQKCTFTTNLKLAAINHTMLHNKGASRRSIRLKHKQDSVTDSERVHSENDAISSTRLHNKGGKFSAERKKLDVTLYRMDTAISPPRKWPVGNRRKRLLAKLKGLRYLNKIHK